MSYGRHELQVVLFQMARLPEASVKNILDDEQWRALSPRLEQWKVREQLLRANGYLPADTAPGCDANSRSRQ